VELEPESIYLTHYGRVTDVARLAAALREQIERFVVLAREHATVPARYEPLRGALRDYLAARAEAHGVAHAGPAVDAVLGADLELDTQGLIAWLDRSQKRTLG